MLSDTVNDDLKTESSAGPSAGLYYGTRQCRIGGMIRLAYGIQNERLRRLCMKLAYSTEGGPFVSYTARQILKEYYEVEVGAYSYGSCMEPGALPRGARVGRYVSIGLELRAFRRNHPVSWLSMHPFFYNPELEVVDRETIPFRPLEIGHDSWIGGRVLITPGCSSIGIGSVVGAGSVVTKDVPDFAIVAGNPAKLIRYRFPSRVCEWIRSSCWWELSLQELIPMLPALTEELGEEPWQHPLLGSISRHWQGSGSSVQV